MRRVGISAEPVWGDAPWGGAFRLGATEEGLVVKWGNRLGNRLATPLQ